MKYCYLITEGLHDVEFLVQVIKKSYKLKRITKKSDLGLGKFWECLIPKTFPPDPNSEDFTKPVIVPKFLQNNELSIAVQNAIGIDSIANSLEDDLLELKINQLFSIGIVLDADKTEPSKRFDELIENLSSREDFRDLNISLPSSLDKITNNNNSPRFGVFILPNNNDLGTLENILLECAEINYTNLLELSRNYVENIDRTKLNSDDLREIKKLAGENKAIVSSISSILKPGRTLQVSLQDNRWINQQTLTLQSLILIKNFLGEILGI